MNYVPLTRDERTHEIKKLGEFDVNWCSATDDLFFYHVGVWKLGPDYTLVVVFTFQIVQLFEIVLCPLSSAYASVLSTLS